MSIKENCIVKMFISYKMLNILPSFLCIVKCFFKTLTFYLFLFNVNKQIIASKQASKQDVQMVQGNKKLTHFHDIKSTFTNIHITQRSHAKKYTHFFLWQIFLFSMFNWVSLFHTDYTIYFLKNWLLMLIWSR